MLTNTPTSQQPFVCSLEEACEFRGDDVIERFVRRFNVTEVQAQILFGDVKQWLWLAALSRVERKDGTVGVPERLIIDTPMLIVDQMWHNFICFTKMYQNYCESHFGKMIHHLPTTEAQKTQILNKLLSDPNHQIQRKRIQYSYIYEKLGEATLRRWYVEYPALYTPEEVLKLRKA
jgi:hypothetical protein